MGPSWIPWIYPSSGRTDSAQPDKKQPRSLVEGDAPQTAAVPDGSLSKDRSREGPTTPNIPALGGNEIKDDATNNVGSDLDKRAVLTEKDLDHTTRDANHAAHPSETDNLESLRGDENRYTPDALSEDSAHARGQVDVASANLAEATNSADSQQRARFRAELSEKRASSNLLRSRFVNAVQTVNQSDIAFMSSVEHLLQLFPEISVGSLFRDFEHLKQARSDLELEHNAWQMSDQEFVTADLALLKNEKLFEEARVTSAIALPYNASNSDGVLLDSHHSEISSRNLRADKSAEAQQYLSQVGEVDLLREDLMNMDVEYARILYDQAMRDVIGQKLDDYSQAFLENFESERIILVAQLQQAELLEVQLRQRVPGMEMHPSPQGKIVRKARSDSLLSRSRLPLGREQYVDDDLAHEQATEDPKTGAAAELSLAGREERQPPYSNVVAMEGGESVDKKGYIDDWLSHHLQPSFMELAYPENMQKAAGIDVGLTVQNDSFSTQLIKGDSKRSEDIDRPTHEGQDASVATQNDRDHASKPASDLRDLVGETIQHFEPRFDTRSDHSAD